MGQKFDTPAECSDMPTPDALETFRARQALIDAVSAENDALLADLLGGACDFAAAA